MQTAPFFFFFFQAEDGIRDIGVTGVQTCALPILDGKTLHPGQANNFYIFPAIGLAVYATRPKRIDDRMFIEAARGSADQRSEERRVGKECRSRWSPYH